MHAAPSYSCWRRRRPELPPLATHQRRSRPGASVRCCSAFRLPTPRAPPFGSRRRADRWLRRARPDRRGAARRRRVAVGHGDGRRRRQHRGISPSPPTAPARSRWPMPEACRAHGAAFAAGSPPSRRGRSPGRCANGRSLTSSCFPSRRRARGVALVFPAAGLRPAAAVRQQPAVALTAPSTVRSRLKRRLRRYPGTAARRTRQGHQRSTTRARSGDPRYACCPGLILLLSRTSPINTHLRKSIHG